MTTTWISEDGEPVSKKISIFGWMRVFSRGSAIILIILFGLILKFVLRLFEKPLFGDRRPVTPYITVLVSKISLWLLSITWADPRPAEAGRRPAEGLARGQPDVNRP